MNFLEALALLATLNNRTFYGSPISRVIANSIAFVSITVISFCDETLLFTRNTANVINCTLLHVFFMLPSFAFKTETD